MERDVDRRRILTTVGSLSAVGVSGCIDSVGDPAEQPAAGATESSDDAGAETGGQEADHDQAEGTDHELGDPRAETQVELLTDDGHHFRPHVVHVERGGTVTWSVVSGEHDTRSYHPDSRGDQQRIPDGTAPWASDPMGEEGDSFERTFETEGVYDYACSPHEAMGMVGTVVVGWPDPGGEPALEPPSDDRPEAAVEQLEKLNEQVRIALEAGEDDGNVGDDDHGEEDTHDGDDDHGDGDH